MESIFKFLSIPIGWVMRMLYGIIPNYIVVLLIFAFLIKLLLFPLGIKQQKNMVKQAAMRPKENAIRKKYAGRTDKATQQKMQNEIMELYQSENFNPMSGCLPLFLQLPILYAFYFVIRSPLTYICGLSEEAVESIKNTLLGCDITLSTSATEIDVISLIRSNDLFEKVSEVFAGTAYTTVDKLPTFNIGSFDLSLTPGFHEPWYLLAIPVLTFVIMFFSMKLTRKFSYQPQMQQGQNGCSTASMDLMMPLMSVWITFITPGIIGIYWIFQNILGTLQQYILKCMYPYPTFTEEELKAAEKEMLGTSRKGKKSDDENKPRVRSLHHIDDDEYNAQVVAPKQEETTSAEPNELIGKAKLKDDNNDKQ